MACAFTFLTLALLALDVADQPASPEKSAAAPPPRPPSLLRPPTSTPTTREPTADQYRLERAKDSSGDLLYDASGFKARIARDGTVSFHDKHVSALHFVPIVPQSAPGNVPTLQGVILGRGRKDPKAPPPDPIVDETRYPATSVSRFRPDTREACQYPRPCFFDAAAVVVGASGVADVTDEVMRMSGKDPYRYAKARFLTATRELRIRMAGRAHADDVQRSTVELPLRLDQIVCDRRLSVRDRRGIIQALRAELDSSSEAQNSAAAIVAALDRLATPDGGVDRDPPARCPPDRLSGGNATGTRK
ncbi:MAG TPA: hypothetical protein VH374_14250 [Polyangia bacterium]|jgi:hypothetical protein|nr:hypothetical protein [Polyangia bacterium]